MEKTQLLFVLGKMIKQWLNFIVKEPGLMVYYVKPTVEVRLSFTRNTYHLLW